MQVIKNVIHTALPWWIEQWRHCHSRWCLQGLQGADHCLLFTLCSLRWDCLTAFAKMCGFQVDLIYFWFSPKGSPATAFLSGAQEAYGPQFKKYWDNTFFLPASSLPWFSHLTLFFTTPLLYSLFFLPFIFDVFFSPLFSSGASSLVPGSGCHQLMRVPLFYLVNWSTTGFLPSSVSYFQPLPLEAQTLKLVGLLTVWPRVNDYLSELLCATIITSVKWKS